MGCYHRDLCLVHLGPTSIRTGASTGKQLIVVVCMSNVFGASQPERRNSKIMKILYCCRLFPNFPSSKLADICYDVCYWLHLNISGSAVSTGTNIITKLDKNTTFHTCLHHQVITRFPTPHVPSLKRWPSNLLKKQSLACARMLS